MKLSSSTSNGDIDEIEEGEIISEDYTVYFEKILDTLAIYQKTCRHIPRDDVIPLAQLLVERGCRIHSALWIAIKFAGVHNSIPGAELMARGSGMSICQLVKHEAEDLQHIDWDIAPLARACGLMD